jgi:polysaccharide export outer membrane protein
MRYPTRLLLLLLLISVASCVPKKRITYLQENAYPDDQLITIQQQQPPYRLQVADVLSIRVKALDQELVEMFNPVGSNSTTLNEGYYYDGFAVDKHGNIRIPTLGELNVLGRTPDEVREMIEKKLLEDYFTENANIFVTVKLAGIRYTIAGEIGSSGVKTELTEKLSLLDAIANSGGVPITGDLTDVLIVRQYPGGQKVHHLDLTQIDVMQSPYYYIQPNDLILVNPLPQKTVGIGTTGLDSFRTILTIFTSLVSVYFLATRL